MEKIGPTVPPQGAKTCFLLFFLLLMQLGLSVTYLAPISTIFEIDVKNLTV